MSSPISVTVQAYQGVLSAGYQEAAVLSDCILQRQDETLNNQFAHFTAKIVRLDDFWGPRATHLLFAMQKGVYWKWCIVALEMKSGHVTGIVSGNPEVWHES